MYLDPNFQVVKGNEEFLSFIEQGNKEVSQFATFDKSNGVISLEKKDILKNDRIMLTPIEGNKALFLLANGKTEVDFIKA